MPDREKVIKAWECCNPFNRKCNECPYEKDCYHDGISRHMVADAIALLKEQEHKDRMYHALEDDWKRLKELLKEQEDKIRQLRLALQILNGNGIKVDTESR